MQIEGLCGLVYSVDRIASNPIVAHELDECQCKVQIGSALYMHSYSAGNSHHQRLLFVFRRLLALHKRLEAVFWLAPVFHQHYRSSPAIFHGVAGLKTSFHWPIADT
ncbi:hypothetical protein BCR37DRAFT_255835 [Protomyces lactucae-debilis]|uniref:Uncharacterized protein n=1 Tax=Protomyces lactucae-debilis TaxID=2754530 RepID=A0A1Y2FLY1_PROLT|nr:uncharacterized protein BCR37DRAFT_255835 [Protomyces lactucae-debilis]ORY84982.1 hypothetical protein BCR37DRAFT_255835 [Protomyces lactucae-debilis]